MCMCMRRLCYDIILDVSRRIALQNSHKFLGYKEEGWLYDIKDDSLMVYCNFVYYGSLAVSPILQI